MTSAAPVWGDPAAWANPAPLEGTVERGRLRRRPRRLRARRGRRRAASAARASSGSTPARSAAAPPGATAASCSPAAPASTTTPSRPGARSAPSALYRATLRRDRPAGGRARAGSCGASARCASRPPRTRPRTARAQHAALVRDGFPAERPRRRRRVYPGRRRDPAARALPPARRARAGRAARACTATRRCSRSRGDRVAHRRRRGALRRRRRLRRRRPRAAAARARGQRALDAPADAGHRARRARHGPLPVYDNWGYDYWQQLPDGRIALGGGRDRHAERVGAAAEPSAAVQARLDELLRDRRRRRARRSRTAGRAWSAYTEDRLPDLRRGPARRAGRRRVLGPRQRARLRHGPRRGGVRARRAAAVPGTAPEAGVSGTDQEACA